MNDKADNLEILFHLCRTYKENIFLYLQRHHLYRGAESVPREFTYYYLLSLLIQRKTFVIFETRYAIREIALLIVSNTTLCSNIDSKAQISNS